MAVSEAQKRATAKYEREKYDKVLIRFPKGTKERIQSTGAESLNGFIIQCVLDALESAEAIQKPYTPATEPQKASGKELTVEEVQAMLEARRAQNEENKRQAAYSPQDRETVAEQCNSQGHQQQQKQTEDLLEKMRGIAQMSRENRKTEEK